MPDTPISFTKGGVLSTLGAWHLGCQRGCQVFDNLGGARHPGCQQPSLKRVKEMARDDFLKQNRPRGASPIRMQDVMQDLRVSQSNATCEVAMP